MHSEKYSLEIGGKTITAEFTDLAEQANGSVIIRSGESAVLVTAVMGKHPIEGRDYFPLSVDYEERFYAAGAILGSRFMRREGRPSDEAILSGRIVDRTIRPLFPQYVRHEVQVVVTVLSIGEEDPDTLGVLGASLALGVSDIPWGGPVGAVRLGKNKNGSFVFNPSYMERRGEEYELDILVCGKDGQINMIEVSGKQVPEEVLAEGLEKGSALISEMESWQKKIIKERGVSKKEMPAPEIPSEYQKLFDSKIAPLLDEHLFSGPGKKKLNELEGNWLEAVKKEISDSNGETARHIFEEAVNEALHKEAVQSSRRPDNRKMDELRPLYAKAGGISPVLHGSGVFYRGATHVLTTLTLGGPQDSLLINSMEEQEGKKRFMHHYNFPPYSSGETGRMGSTNRRMIGHGALAEKAIAQVIPSMDKFPYTIRLVSECLSSNGSTSMGSVCGSTLALMDGGVPIEAPVAGIAMGLMYESPNKYKVLTDIQGPEDHHGDMDFKVAGTKNGITAVQLDVKVEGVALSILKEALTDAKKARLQILNVIEGAIAAPRADISPNAPKIVVHRIKPDQIGLVIGSGGKTINEIREKTGAEIEIEDDGLVYITGKNGGAEAAQKIIEEMTREYKVGEKFEGVVTRLMDFGAFVKIGYDTEGLVHISEIAPFRVNRVTDVLKEGEKVPVVIKEIDEKDRINLSIKACDRGFAERKGIKPLGQ